MTINFDFLNKDWVEVIDLLPPLCEIHESDDGECYTKIAYDKKNDVIYLLEFRSDLMELQPLKKLWERVEILNDDKHQEPTDNIFNSLNLLHKKETGEELPNLNKLPMNFVSDGELLTQIKKRLIDLDNNINGVRECLKIVEDISGHSSYASGYNLGKLESLEEEKETLKQILRGEYGKD